MKLPEEFVNKLTETNTVATELAKLLRTLNGCASLALLVSFIYFTYQGVRWIAQWF